MNLNALLAIRRSQQPEKQALEFRETGRTWTYAQLHAEALAMGRFLTHHSVNQQDRVVIWAENSGTYVVALMALWLLGAIPVPVNLRYRRREMELILADCTPKAILVDSCNLGLFNSLDIDQGLLNQVTLLSLDQIPTTPGERTPEPVIGSDETALIMYTSGTTGRSKGAMITHNNLVATVTGLVSAWGWQADDVLLLTLPLFHVHGLEVGLLCALSAGASVILNRAFNAEAVLHQLAAGKATLYFAVPTMYFRLMRLMEDSTTPDLSHMRLFCSGSAPLAAEDHRRFRRLTGHVILERYGMTETGMNYSNPLAGDRVPSTVGLPLPGVSGRIVDAQDQVLPNGQEGHLQLRGSNVISAYWRTPEQTAEAFVQDEMGRRWFRTGDMGRFDPNSGYLTLLGRSHECILSGGFNVYPREIEEVLMQCAGVQEAAVVGRPHPEWGETPLAYVVVEDSFDEDAVTAYCRQQLAGFKVPSEFRILPELPRNAMGKLQKFLLPLT